MHSAKAIFFDRDGVIIHEDGEYTFTPEKFILLPEVIEFMKEMKKRDFLFFIITNQGGIGKGLYSKKAVTELHKLLTKELEKHGLKIELFLVCPHHPVSSNCLCRKPDSLLLERAIYLYNLEVKASYLIGDRGRDIEAAKKVGLNSILIQSNSSLFSIIEQVK